MKHIKLLEKCAAAELFISSSAKMQRKESDVRGGSFFYIGNANKSRELFKCPFDVSPSNLNSARASSFLSPANIRIPRESREMIFLLRLLK